MCKISFFFLAQGAPSYKISILDMANEGILAKLLHGVNAQVALCQASEILVSGTLLCTCPRNGLI